MSKDRSKLPSAHVRKVPPLTTKEIYSNGLNMALATLIDILEHSRVDSLRVEAATRILQINGLILKD